jgi:hypothetical protein
LAHPTYATGLAVQAVLSDTAGLAGLGGWAGRID